jgi:hypothetical protein
VRRLKTIMIIQVCKSLFLCLGTVAALLSFAALFVVPGVVDLNRLLVVGFFASIAVNAWLLSGILFYATEQDYSQILKDLSGTLPILILAVFVCAMTVATLSAPLWAKAGFAHGTF